MGFENIYTDDSMLFKGKYRFYKLRDIPADYLLNNSAGLGDKALTAYIKANIEKIKSKEWNSAILPKQPVEVCSKKQYPSKKAAREALAIIRNTEQDHKKPIRSYECDKCSAWHLTSLPIETWNEISKTNSKVKEG